ncbi:hypothetical protein PLICRDRAFT_72627, partial [Plicaturopsis crispa FD-325 SS-3]
PRPANAYLLYRSDKILAIKGAIAAYDAMRPDGAMLSQMTGRLWHSETDAVRAHYKELADEVLAQHKKDYPDYK